MTRRLRPLPPGSALLAFALALALAAAGACLLVAPSASGAVSTYVEGSPARPFTLASPVDTTLSLGPPGDQMLSLALPVQGELPFTAVATSQRLEVGEPGREKEFLSLTWLASKPRGSVVFVSYSVDGGAWLPAVGGAGFDIPRGTHGEDIAYRVTLTTSDATLSPEVDEIAIEWTRWTGRPTDPEPGGGDGSSHQPGASLKPGSGSYTYPDSAPPVSGASGGGSGDAQPGQGGWSGGTAGGSGGSGSGGGSQVAQVDPGEPPPAVETPATRVPAPPVSTPVGPAQPVSGLPVDPEAAITGVPLAESGLSDAFGRPAPPAAASGGQHPFPYLPVSAAAAALALVIFVPWALMAAQLRDLTGTDLARARLLGPFRLFKL